MKRQLSCLSPEARHSQIGRTMDIGVTCRIFICTMMGIDIATHLDLIPADPSN